MKALLIIAVILLFLTLLTFLYLKLYVKYEDEEATLWVGVLFLKFQVYPKKEKKVKQRKKPKKKAKARVAQSSADTGRSADASVQKASATEKPTASAKDKPTDQKKSEKKQKKSKEEIKELITALYELLRAVLRPAGFALRHTRIDHLRLHVVVGGEEPDETAIRYGRWNAAVYGGLATLRNFMKINCKKLMIAVDFTEPETQIAVSATVKIRIFVLLIAAVRMIGRFLANNFKRDKEAAVQTAS